MIRFVPEADSFSGRFLLRLGHLLGLRSETVYSRAIVLLALLFLAVGVLLAAIVWYVLFRQLDLANEGEARMEALKIEEFLETRPGGIQFPPDEEALEEAGRFLDRQIIFRELSPERVSLLSASPGGVLVEKLPHGVASAAFLVPNLAGAFAGEVVVSGVRPFYATGVIIARVVLVSLALGVGLMLLLILLVLDRTILKRIRSLADKVEREKEFERLPVKLDFLGDDELAQLSHSIEELARLVRAGEREFRNVVEDQIESICRFNAEWQITFSNRVFALICAEPPEGRRPSLERCLDQETVRLIQKTLMDLDGVSPSTNFTHLVSNSGEEVWYRSTLRAIFDEQGLRKGGQWVAVDVTSEVVSHRKLVESQRQLRLLSSRLLHSQDEERRRIARELHDSTAQNLSALEMNMAVLESFGGDANTLKLVADTRAISQQVCQELRNISYLLHPPLLEEQGLVFAIRWFADGYTKRNGIPVFLRLSEDSPRMNLDWEIALFRVVQEGLTNIYRHAEATKAWITLRASQGGEFSLEIKDNGEGLPENFSLIGSAGVGLAGMRERINQLGGLFEISSSPYGVRLTCWSQNEDNRSAPAAD